MYRADSQNLLRCQHDIDSEIEISHIVKAQQPHPSRPLENLGVCPVNQAQPINLLSALMFFPGHGRMMDVLNVDCENYWMPSIIIIDYDYAI